MVGNNKDSALKDSILFARITGKDLEIAKQVAHLRFLNKTIGMENDNLSEYIRALVKQDTDAAIEEIKSRRRV